MRKTVPLHIEGKHPDRLLDATKHDIRKSLTRERSRTLPEGADYWDFDCLLGLTKEEAVPVRVGELIAQVDALAKAGAAQFYVQILACPGQRKTPPPKDGEVIEPPTAAPYVGD